MNLTKAAFGFVLISLPFSFLLSNYQKVDLSDFWLVYDYAKNTLDSMEPGSIYYFSGDGSMAGDTEIFSLVYLKKVEKYRSDIDIVSEHQFFYKDVQLTLPEDFFKLEFEDKRRKFFNLLHQIKDRSLYTNFAVTQKDNDLGLFSISNGFTHRVYEDIKEARSAEFSGYFPSLRNLVKIDVNSEHSLTSIASRYYYNMAYLYLILGQNEKSQNCLITAFNLDIFPFNHEYRRFIDYRSEWLAIN